MEASIAVVWVMAKRNESWVMNSPRNEARTIFQTSALSIFSCGAENRDHSQNSSVAPNDLRQNRAMGVMLPSSAMFLQHIILNPKMAYAPKHARLPIKVLFLSFIVFYLIHSLESSGNYSKKNNSFEMLKRLVNLAVVRCLIDVHHCVFNLFLTN